MVDITEVPNQSAITLANALRYWTFDLPVQ